MRQFMAVAALVLCAGFANPLCAQPSADDVVPALRLRVSFGDEGKSAAPLRFDAYTGYDATLLGRRNTLATYPLLLARGEISRRGITLIRDEDDKRLNESGESESHWGWWAAGAAVVAGGIAAAAGGHHGETTGGNTGPTVSGGPSGCILDQCISIPLGN